VLWAGYCELNSKERRNQMAQISLYRPWAADSSREVDQLRREMDSLFSRFISPSPLSSSWRGVFPAVNLYETADSYVLTAELPGVGREDIQVSLEGSTITLQGERKIDVADQEDVSVHRSERQAGSFRRAFELPAPIDADGVEAVHKNGVLMLRLHKTPEARPRQISVQAG
jgi:HSP20 family protein